jgi:hypothetical protein
MTSAEDRHERRIAHGPSSLGLFTTSAPWLAYFLILGLYFTFRGYHSLDGDQAYRLPLLLHQLDPSLYARDPFVRAFDAFNPHRGSLFVLGRVVDVLGLPAGLMAIFLATFLTTCRAIDRMSREVWPEAGAPAGLTAVVLLLAAKAGNIGTNHLFEAMVLDRLMALALAWSAIADCISRPDRAWWRSGALLGLATVIHPSLGLQLALVVMGGWIVWAWVSAYSGVPSSLALKAIATAGIAVIPGLALNLEPGGSLLGGLPSSDLWTLAVELQSPQHMLPTLWRTPQWLAWACYLALAALALGPRTKGRTEESDPETKRTGWHVTRIRLLLLLAVVLFWLGSAWVAIEPLHQLRITLFQPFRMATVARGLALVLVAGRLVHLWQTRHWTCRVRAVLIAIAFAGDWMLVIVTVAELAASVPWDRMPILSDLLTQHNILTSKFNGIFLTRLESGPTRIAIPGAIAHAGVLAYGVYFLSRHDTESGHWPILLVVLGGLIVRRLKHLDFGHWRAFTLRRALALAWAVPALALIAGLVPANHPLGRTALVRGLVARCRFMPLPVDDIERLGLWCREHTPSTAHFIGPPGPKTFRLWSRRNLAFNRAASPYHATGLADWFERFQDHVDLRIPPAEFVRRYVADRHGLEARYDQLSPGERVALASRQGADHVIAPAPLPSQPAPQSSLVILEHLHTEGRYAVYRVNLQRLAQRQR